jgi:hypothetical protein
MPEVGRRFAGEFTGWVTPPRATPIFSILVPRERFQQRKIHPTNYEGKNVEFTGQIKNHPRFGLEMILEDPSQIKLLD